MRYLKQFFLIFFTLLWLPALADEVPQQRAAETAEAFFRGPLKKMSQSPAASAVTVTQAAVSSSHYRVFNRKGGGFVLISGNDAVTPVLAYSMDGEFPAEADMPDNMRFWLEQIELQLAALPADAKASEQVQQMWATPSRKADGNTLLYETALWNQKTPYNDNCPEVNGTRCVTGCVATSASIIARYFQWPEAGTGTVPERASDNPGAYFPAHDLGHSYDYSKMPLDYSDGYSSEQAAAVATLMYDMGTLAKAIYGTGATSATDNNLLTGLKKHMQYNKAAYVARRENYDDDAWIALLMQNLENGPCIYSGSNPNTGAGHEFIVDGYDESGRFHINWGWGGLGNCYCSLSSLVPENIPRNYTADQAMTVDLYPDRNGSSQYRDLLVFKAVGDQTGMSTTATTITKNIPFTVYSGFFTPVINSFTGSVYVALYDKNGNLKQDISSARLYFINLDDYKGFGTTCTITTDIEPGDRIRIRYEGLFNSGVITQGNGCVTEIIVMDEGGGGDDPAEEYSAAEIAASTSLSYDKETEKLTIYFTLPANWSVKAADGTVIGSGSAVGGSGMVVETATFAPGTYTIAVGSSKDPFTFTITK